jgi:hypothetical protein
MKPLTLQVVSLVALVALWSLPSTALVVGQVDTFESGTTEGWVIGAGPNGGGGTPPANQSSGGPAGTDDNYLLLTATGGDGPGSRLSVLNLSQWAGDYAAAGIGAIQFDANNFGTTDLYLRLLFEDPQLGPPTNIAFTDAILVQPGTGWNTLVFSIGADDLTAALGSPADALANATAIRIFASFDPEYPPDPIVASLGVDNFRALQSAVVPEPATAALLALGVLGCCARRKRPPRDA